MFSKKIKNKNSLRIRRAKNLLVYKNLLKNRIKLESKFDLLNLTLLIKVQTRTDFTTLSFVKFQNFHKRLYYQYLSITLLKSKRISCHFDSRHISYVAHPWIQCSRNASIFMAHISSLRKRKNKKRERPRRKRMSYAFGIFLALATRRRSRIRDGIVTEFLIGTDHERGSMPFGSKSEI